MKIIIFCLSLLAFPICAAVAPAAVPGPVFTGDKMNLDFNDIPVRQLIETIADFSGLNIISSEDIGGTITIKLHDVRWDEALDFILMTKGLEKHDSGNVTWIFPLGRIKEYEIKRREISQAYEETGEIETAYIRVNYARADDFRSLIRGQDSRGFGGCGINSNTSSQSGSSPGINQPFASGLQFQQQQQFVPSSLPGGGSSISPAQLQSSNGALNQSSSQNAYSLPSPAALSVQTLPSLSLLSRRGSVIVEQRTNTLIIRDSKKRIDDIQKLIFKLDIPVKQVMVESRLVISNKSFAKQLGVQFGVSNTSATASSTSTSTGQPSGVQPVVNSAISALSISNPYGQVGLVLAKSAGMVLSTQFTALEDKGEGKVLSQPRVLTSDRCQAKISQGYDVPFQSSSGLGGTNIQFKQAVLELDVLPQITPNGGVIMVITIKKDEIDAAESVNGQPSLITRNITTTVHVSDGETLVLGGISEDDKSHLINEVPWFAGLPYIGWMFQRSSDSDNNQELLVFITPKIINL